MSNLQFKATNSRLNKTNIFQKFGLVILGLFTAIIILEIGLRLGGWILLSIQENKKCIYASNKDTYRIMCLGESSTAYQYPHLLEEIINQRNIGIKFSVIDRGVVGVNTPYIG